MKQSIIDNFHTLALPAKDKKGGKKVKALLSLLKELSVDAEYIPGIGVLANKLESPKVILVSHFDLITKFRKAFKEEYILEIDEEKDSIKGALDNTITNATIISLLQAENIDLRNVEILFSEGEEVGFHGMIEYLKVYKDRVKDSFFVNLDVTNEGFNTHASFEYDKPNFNVIKSCQSLFKSSGHDVFYTCDREGDDLDAVVYEGMHGVSYCLPTKSGIHSFRNWAKLSSLEPYAFSLGHLLQAAVDFQGAKKDFSPYSLKKALKHDTREAFDKDSSYTPRHNNYDSLWGDSDLGDNFVTSPAFDDSSWNKEVAGLWEDVEDDISSEPWQVIPNFDNIDWYLANKISSAFMNIDFEGKIEAEKEEEYAEYISNYLLYVQNDKNIAIADLNEMFDQNEFVIQKVLDVFLEQNVLQEVSSSDMPVYKLV